MPSSIDLPRHLTCAIPDDPGSTPIESDRIRLFHKTRSDGLNIIERGLLLEMARGPRYAEPPLVWGSCNQGDFAFRYQVVVEYTLSWAELLSRWFTTVGGPMPGTNTDPARFMARRGNVGVAFDVPASDVIAVHFPWQSAYRYIMQNEDLLADLLDGKFDDVVDPVDKLAIERIKHDNALRLDTAVSLA